MKTTINNKSLSILHFQNTKLKKSPLYIRIGYQRKQTAIASTGKIKVERDAIIEITKLHGDPIAFIKKIKPVNEVCSCCGHIIKHFSIMEIILNNQL